jgi:ribosomal protein S18 acetylase RimI-like enzyme
MEELFLKESGTDDAAVIAWLADTIWRVHYPGIISEEQIEYMLRKMYSEESIAEQMKSGQRFYLVQRGLQTIGYISVSKEENHTWKLNKFYILPEEQGRGTGSAVLKLAIQKMDGANAVMLTVNRQNFKAINFYFKNEFIISAVKDFEIGNGYEMNDFIMTRRIS